MGGGAISGPWLIALCGLAMAVLWAALYLTPDAQVARRVIVQFFITIALPVGLILGLPLVVIYRFTELDPRVWQALIAGLVIATGWLTTAIFTELARQRTRSERLRDYHKALYAEMVNALSTLYDGDEAERYGAALIARMEADADFVPFIPRERHDHIYDAIIEEIEVLPRQTIDPIVAYYTQVKSVMALGEDMRSDGFRGLEQARRVEIYRDYMAMRRVAFQLGQFALRIILAYTEGGPEGAARATRRINTPDAGRSGRSAE